MIRSQILLLTQQSQQLLHPLQNQIKKPTATPTPTATPKPDKKPEEESKYESDLSGGTASVNSSTTLADGTYTPDSFSWSGGSGKVSISCNKVTVTNGQAYATIVFSSEYYGYVKPMEINTTVHAAAELLLSQFR